VPTALLALVEPLMGLPEELVPRGLQALVIYMAAADKVERAAAVMAVMVV
jgi:hypothetical protein